MKYMDLSVPINEETPIFPGDSQTKIVGTGRIEEAGYQNHYLSLSNHLGTHIDVPSHVIQNGKNLDQFPLETFFAEGICIDVGKSFDLEAIKLVTIPERAILLFYTGMGRKYYDPSYFKDYPTFPKEVAEYLVLKKIKMVGVDMCSVDHESPLIHTLFLKNDILILENLTNLDRLANKTFRVYVLPLNLQLDGAPTRIVAEVID